MSAIAEAIVRKPIRKLMGEPRKVGEIISAEELSDLPQSNLDALLAQGILELISSESSDTTRADVYELMDILVARVDALTLRLDAVASGIATLESANVDDIGERLALKQIVEFEDEGKMLRGVVKWLDKRKKVDQLKVLYEDDDNEVTYILGFKDILRIVED